jgi:hypothetical protein
MSQMDICCVLLVKEMSVNCRLMAMELLKHNIWNVELCLLPLQHLLCSLSTRDKKRILEQRHILKNVSLPVCHFIYGFEGPLLVIYQYVSDHGRRLLWEFQYKHDQRWLLEIYLVQYYKVCASSETFISFWHHTMNAFLIEYYTLYLMKSSQAIRFLTMMTGSLKHQFNTDTWHGW